METRVDFLAPRLTGERFDSHTLPVNLLEDFSALEELIFEVAKQLYLDENPNKKRVPNGFTEDVRLSISGIEEGSAITKLVLIFTSLSTSFFPDSLPGNWKYIEKAKDKVIDAISYANQKEGSVLEDKHVVYFNRIGRNLREGESIDFLPDTNKKAILTPKVRNKILQSKSESYETYEPCSFYASIPSVDKKAGMFKLDIDGNSIECSLNSFSNFYDTILNVFNDYEKNTFALIEAIGTYNDQKKLIGIHGIKSIEILNPYDVGVRLHYLSKLNNNWYNEYSKAPSSTFLNGFKNYFYLYFDKQLVLPSIFPTFEGNIQLEWSLVVAAVVLEVSQMYISDLLVAYHDGEIDEMELNLNNKADWQLLNERLKSLQ